jgi:hypothetical protein
MYVNEGWLGWGEFGNENGRENETTSESSSSSNTEGFQARVVHNPRRYG